MDRMLYVAMSGAKETLIAQGNAANNLANASTPGFLSDLNQFRSMPVYGDGFPTRVYALDERPETDFTHGSVVHTGRDLDIAIKGDAWLAVQAPDGNEAYTRRGDLQIDQSGRLLTGSGLQVMGNDGPIALPPAENMNIGVDGTITILPLGAAKNELAVIDRIKLVNPQNEELVKGLDGLMRLRDGDIAEVDSTGRVASGGLEASNVNVVNEMVNMIELSRRFELQVKMMAQVESMAESAATIMRQV